MGFARSADQRFSGSPCVFSVGSVWNLGFLAYAAARLPYIASSFAKLII
jgi:hypothetical protein